MIEIGGGGNRADQAGGSHRLQKSTVAFAWQYGYIGRLIHAWSSCQGQIDFPIAVEVTGNNILCRERRGDVDILAECAISVTQADSELPGGSHQYYVHIPIVVEIGDRGDAAIERIMQPEGAVPITQKHKSIHQDVRLPVMVHISNGDETYRALVT